MFSASRSQVVWLTSEASCARGRYLAVLNHDDRWSPHFLATLVAPLEGSPEVALAFSDHNIIDATGRFLAAETEAKRGASAAQAAESPLAASPTSSARCSASRPASDPDSSGASSRAPASAIPCTRCIVTSNGSIRVFASS